MKMQMHFDEGRRAMSKRERDIAAPEGSWSDWREGGQWGWEDLQPGLCLRNGEVDLHGIEEPLDELQFENCAFVNLDFRRLTLRDVRFSRCELPLAQFGDSSLYRVKFDHCRLAGADFTRCSMREIRFEDCMMDYASFGGAKIKHMLFCGGRMQEGSLQSAQWEDLRWEGITIDGTDISDTMLRGMDLSRCEFSHLRISAHLASGLRIRSDQAPTMIRAFEVELVD